jgi:hypothetical protein
MTESGFVEFAQNLKATETISLSRRERVWGEVKRKRADAQKSSLRA